jgi:GntR family transcriptional regulator
MSIGTINKDLPIPLYHQLKENLLAAIEGGRWKIDEQLPNETALAKHFGVSKITVRQALRELASMGYIRREQGRGTFVSKPKFSEGPRELTSFTEEMRRYRLPASSRVLEQKVVPADAAVAEALDIEEGDEVLLLKRLRLAGGEPMGIQTAHIPLALAPGIAGEDFNGVSLYELLESKYGLRATSARETCFAVLVDPEAAALLGVAPASAALAAERIAVSQDGKAFEFVTSIMHGDRYRIVLNLVK